MTCPTELTLTLYLDDALAASTRRKMDAHLAACPTCRAAAKVLADVEALLRSAPDDAAPDGLTERVLAVPDRDRRRRVALLAVPTALAAALLVVLWLGSGPAPSGGGPLPKPDLRTRLLSALEHGDEQWLEEKGEHVLEPLHRIALDEDPDAARRALLRLAGLGRRESLPVFCDATARADRRDEAVDALAALGDPRALRVLRPLLDDRRSWPRVLPALRSLGGDDAARAVAARLDAEEDPLAALPLLDCLAEMEGTAATLALLRLAERPGLMADARAALIEGAEARMPELAAIARDGGQEDVRRAIEVLPDLGRPEVVAVLAEMLDRRDHRETAARALARVDTADAARALLAAGDGDHVRRAFAAMGTDAEGVLLDLLAEGRPGERARASGLLGLCGGTRAVRTLEGLAQDRVLGKRAVESLGTIGSAEAVAALARLARDSTHRRTAVAALGGTGSEHAVPALAALAAEDRGLRREVLAALARIPSPRAVEAVLVVDPGPASRGAVRTLRRMRRSLVVPALTAMLKGDHRRDARGALVAMGAAPRSRPRAALN